MHDQQAPAGSQELPGLDLNPGPGKIKSRDFLGFGMAHKGLFWFSDNLRVFWGLPEPFKVLQMFTL